MKTTSDRLFPGIRHWVAAFLVLFLGYYVLHGRRITPDTESDDRFHLLTGDEPHYLLLAHSIAFDGDIHLRNNKKQKDYEAYYRKHASGYTKDKTFWLRYVKGKLRSAPDSYWEQRCYSVCPVGMPALIAPAYRLGHAWGGRVRYCVAVFLHALAAALVLVVADLTWHVTRHRWWTCFSAGCLAFSAPLLFYTVPAYPGLPGAFFVATGVWLLCRLENTTGHARSAALVACVGITAGCIPWMHARLWPQAGLVVLAAAWIVARRRNRRVVLSAVGTLAFLLMVVPLSVYYYRLYGVPYPVSTHPPLSLGVGLKTGWLGLWLDGNCGLLWYAPLAVMAFPGAWFLWRSRPTIGRLVVLLILANWLLIGLFSDWRGGLCPPLRYWLPVFPLLTVPCALCLASARKWWVSAAGALSAFSGVAMSVAAMLDAGRMFKYKHPVLPYWNWAHFGSIAPKLFPETRSGDYVRVALYLLALVAFSVVVLRFGVATEEHRDAQ